MPDANVKIAVIGGGISGLSTAWYLMQQARKTGSGLRVHLYERSAMLGGNADTVVVDLGERYDEHGPAGRYKRWADLGVNDVNMAAYHKLRTLMTQVGYIDRMPKLQDTESYFSGDGRIMLTDDSNLRNGVSDTEHSLEHADGGRLAPLIKVVHRTALNMLKPEGEQELPDSYTVGQFFQDCIDDPKGMLSAAAAQAPRIEIDWNDPALPQRVATVRDHIYFPRISAMYFTDDLGPQHMPLRSPFEYYKIQEGGGETPDRRYFDHGSQTWLEHLAQYMLDHSDSKVGLEIRQNAKALVSVRHQGVTIKDGEQAEEAYDLCVVATHADDARELFLFEDAVSHYYTRLDAILASVRYTGSYAVCHTHSASMPPNKNTWRTYNIQVRDRGDTFTPYRINYVVNLHQNDPCNPEYDRAGLPQYFVSLVDNLNSIPQQYMLNRVLDRSQVPAGMLAGLPQATLDQMDGEALASGYSSRLQHVAEPLRHKAWTYFKHNVLNAACLSAQKAMQAYNEETAQAWGASRKPPCPLFFGGGWTRGAGLHEQCLEQSEMIARWVLPD